MSQINFGPPFLGRGWAFPVCPDAGQTAMAAYEDDVKQAIQIILGTNPGERVMRPDFGAGLNAFVFEPMSFTTTEALRNRVKESLVDWEPRIDVDKVTLEVLPDEGKVLINVSYRVRATNSHFNLVYPFYLAEGVKR